MAGFSKFTVIVPIRSNAHGVTDTEASPSANAQLSTPAIASTASLKSLDSDVSNATLNTTQAPIPTKGSSASLKSDRSNVSTATLINDTADNEYIENDGKCEDVALEQKLPMQLDHAVDNPFKFPAKSNDNTVNTLEGKQEDTKLEKGRKEENSVGNDSVEDEMQDYLHETIMEDEVRTCPQQELCN